MRYEPTSVTLNSTEQTGHPIQPGVVVGVTAILVVHHSICYEETMLPGTKLMLPPPPQIPQIRVVMTEIW